MRSFWATEHHWAACHMKQPVRGQGVPWRASRCHAPTTSACGNCCLLLPPLSCACEGGCICHWSRSADAGAVRVVPLPEEVSHRPQLPHHPSHRCGLEPVKGEVDARPPFADNPLHSSRTFKHSIRSVWKRSEVWVIWHHAGRLHGATCRHAAMIGGMSRMYRQGW